MPRQETPAAPLQFLAIEMCTLFPGKKFVIHDFEASTGTHRMRARARLFFDSSLSVGVGLSFLDTRRGNIDTAWCTASFSDNWNCTLFLGKNTF